MLLIALFLICMNSLSAMALSEEEIAKIEKETWAITIDTDVDDIYPAAIQYAIVGEDPIPIFKVNYEKLSSNDNLKDDYSVTIMVSWDSMFRIVPGDELGLLSAKSEGQFSMRSGEPEGKKWLITKVVTKSNGAILCWCIPIEVKTGEVYTVKLDDGNYLDLEKLVRKS